MSTTTQARRKHTGEPGNGGRYASHVRLESTHTSSLSGPTFSSNPDPTRTVTVTGTPRQQALIARALQFPYTDDGHRASEAEGADDIADARTLAERIRTGHFTGKITEADGMERRYFLTAADGTRFEVGATLHDAYDGPADEHHELRVAIDQATAKVKRLRDVGSPGTALRRAEHDLSTARAALRTYEHENHLSSGRLAQVMPPHTLPL